MTSAFSVLGEDLVEGEEVLLVVVGVDEVAFGALGVVEGEEVV